MNRNLGGSAGIIALLAFVLHMAIPAGQDNKPGEANTAASGGAGKSKPAATVQTANSNTVTLPEEGPWLATRHFFRSEPNPATPLVFNCSIVSAPKQKEDCERLVAGYFGIDKSEKDTIEVLMATVPDPLHTRLAFAHGFVA